MTPKDKCDELIDKYIKVNGNSFFAKECALITVDEIIEVIRESADKDIIHIHLIYWRKVKKELLKLQNNE